MVLFSAKHPCFSFIICLSFSSLLCWLYLKPPNFPGGYFTVPAKLSPHCCPHPIWLNYILLWPFSGPLASFWVTWNSLFLLSLVSFSALPHLTSIPDPLAPTSCQKITSCSLIHYPNIPFFTAQCGTPDSSNHLPLLLHHLLWPTTIHSNYLYITETFVPYGCSSWTAWPWRWMHYNPAKYQVLLTRWYCVTSQKIWALCLIYFIYWCHE